MSNPQADIRTFAKEMQAVAKASNDLFRSFTQVNNALIKGAKQAKQWEREVKYVNALNTQVKHLKRNLIELGQIEGKRLSGAAKSAWAAGASARRQQMYVFGRAQHAVTPYTRDAIDKYVRGEEMRHEQRRGHYIRTKSQIPPDKVGKLVDLSNELRETTSKFAIMLRKISYNAGRAAGKLQHFAGVLKNLGIKGIFGSLKGLLGKALIKGAPLLAAGALGTGIGGAVGSALTGNWKHFVSALKDMGGAAIGTGKVIAGMVPLYLNLKLWTSAFGKKLLAATAALAKFTARMSMRAAQIHEQFLGYEAILSSRFGATNVGRFKTAIFRGSREAGMPFEEAMASFNLATAVPSSRKIIWNQNKQSIDQTMLTEMIKTIQAVRMTQPDVAARFGMMWPNIMSGDTRSFRHAFETGVPEMADTIKLTSEQAIISERRINQELQKKLSDAMQKGDTAQAKILRESIETSNGYLNELLNRAKKLPTAADYQSGDPRRVMEFMIATGRTYLGERERAQLARTIHLLTAQIKAGLKDMLHTVTGATIGETTGVKGMYNLIQDRIEGILEFITSARNVGQEALISLRTKLAGWFDSTIMKAMDTLFANILGAVNVREGVVKNIFNVLQAGIGQIVKMLLDAETYIVALMLNFFNSFAQNSEVGKLIIEAFKFVMAQAVSLVDSLDKLGRAADSATDFLERFGLTGAKKDSKEIAKVAKNARKQKELKDVDSIKQYMLENSSAFGTLSDSAQTKIAQEVLSSRGARGTTNNFLNKWGKFFPLSGIGVLSMFGGTPNVGDVAQDIAMKDFQNTAGNQAHSIAQNADANSLLSRAQKLIQSGDVDQRTQAILDLLRAGKYAEALSFITGVPLEQLKESLSRGEKGAAKVALAGGFQPGYFNFGANMFANQARTLVASHMKRYGNTIALKFGDATIHIVDGRPVERKIRLRPKRTGDKRGAKRAQRRSDPSINRPERPTRPETASEANLRNYANIRDYTNTVRAQAGLPPSTMYEESVVTTYGSP